MIGGNVILAMADVLHLLIQVYVFILIIRSILSWVGNIPQNQFVFILRKLTDPVFRFTHRMFPFMIHRGIDFSPIVIVLLLFFIDRYFIMGLMMRYGLSLIQGG